MTEKITTVLLIALLFLFSAHLAFAKPMTLYDYYDGNLPSIEERAVTAAQFGIFNYRGTFNQNIRLLDILNNLDVDTQSDLLGFSVVTNYKTTLSASMTSSQSTVPVSSVTTKDDHTLTMSDLGNEIYLVIEPGGNKEEIVRCTGISSTTWTSCTRGLAFYGTDVSAVSDNQKTHSAGAVVVMSNVHYVYDELVDKDSSETIAGVKTYSSYPKIASYTAPTADEEFAPKKYVDDVTNAGAADITETVKGIGELATPSELAAGTATGGTGANLVPHADDFNATSSATTLVPVTGADGKLDQGFIDLTEDFTFSGSNVNITPAASFQLGGTAYNGTMADLNEAEAFFDGTDITDTEAETLTDGSSDASSLHAHGDVKYFKAYMDDTAASGDINSEREIQATSDPGADNVYLAFRETTTVKIKHFAKDAIGTYYLANETTLTDSGDDLVSDDYIGLAASDNYVWIASMGNSTSDVKIFRYSKTLGSKTDLTISGTALAVGDVGYLAADDDELFITEESTSTNINYYTVSGTTATRGSDITLTDQGQDLFGIYYDGTDLIHIDSSFQLDRQNTSGSSLATQTRNIGVKTNLFDPDTNNSPLVVGVGPGGPTGTMFIYSFVPQYDTVSTVSVDGYILEGFLVDKP